MLFIILDAGWFGHTRTALSVTRAFWDNGHEISFLFDLDYSDNIICRSFKDDDIRFFFIKRTQHKEYNLLDTIKRITDMGTVDVVHSFEFCGLYETISACRKLKIPHIQTVCSSYRFRRFYPADNIVYICKEFQDQTNRWKKYISNRRVIQSRVDSVELEKGKQKFKLGNLAQKFIRKYELNEDDVIVMRVCQVGKWYIRGLLKCVEEIADLRDLGLKITFVHIGNGEKSYVEELHQKMSEVNGSHRENFAVSAQDEFRDAAMYLNMSDLVVGSGRTAFEGMYYRKPVFIIRLTDGSSADLVEKTTLRRISYYNFSGRHLERNKSKQKTLSEQIKNLYENRRRIDQVLSDCHSYFDEYIDAKLIYPQYSEIYENLDFWKASTYISLLLFIKFYLAKIVKHIVS